MAKATPDPEPVVVEFDEAERYKTAPISRATAIQNAEAIASQVSNGYGASVGASGAVYGLPLDKLERKRTDFADRWDSYWSRDPGRAHGPYS